MECSFWSILTTLLLGFLAIYYFYHRKFNYFKKNDIFHVPSLPFIGNMTAPLFRLKSLTEHLHEIYLLNENAKYVGFHEFTTPMIMIRDQELIKSVTVKNFDYFTDRLGLATPEQDPIFGNMLFSIHGNKWRELRSQLSPVLTSSKIKQLFNLTNNYTKQFVDHLMKRCTEEPITIDTKDAFTRFTNDVTAAAIFGVVVDSMKEPKNDFYVFGKEATAIDGFASIKYVLARNFPLIAKLTGLKLVKTEGRRFFLDVVKKTLKLRSDKNLVGLDMIQLMMQINATKSNETEEISLELMTALAFGFYFGGLDTASTMQCFVAHMITVNPEIYKRLQIEIDQVMDDNNGEPSYEAINEMHYLEAVILETMRIYPPVSFLDRICTKNFQLPPCFPGGKPVQIKPGTCLWIPTYSIQRDPRNFENPDKFDPERFIGNRKNSVNPSIYLPFGTGPRMCTGKKFALLECKILFCHLLYHCKLNISPKTRVPLKLSTSTVLMGAEGGFLLELESRTKSK